MTTPLPLADRLRYVHRLSFACTGYKECAERTSGRVILVRVAVVFLTLTRHAVVIVGPNTYASYRVVANQAAIFLASRNEQEREIGREASTAARTETGSSLAALRIAILPPKSNAKFSRRLRRSRVQSLPFPLLQSDAYIAM